MAKSKPIEEVVVEEVVKTPEQVRKEYLLTLLQTLKDEGINSIGDLENKIAVIK